MPCIPAKGYPPPSAGAHMKTVRQVLARMISTKYLHTSTNLQESKPQGYQLHAAARVSMLLFGGTLECIPAAVLHMACGSISP